jgi:DNA-binding transcriptional regulator GbsR (MarR family)
VVPSAEQRFAERMGLYFETSGGTRIMGLVYGWLIVCVPAHVSITELAQVLGVSKASVSTTVRQLEAAAMVERVPVPGTRQHHYQLRGGGWTQVLRNRFARMAPIVAAADEMLRQVADDDASRVERLAEVRDFFKFVEVDTDLITERWEAYRKRAVAERTEAQARRVRGRRPP